MEDINENRTPEVFKTYDDGYIVRGMTLSDAKIVQKWYSGMGIVSEHDLNVTLAAHPPGRGFYIGEYEGVVVASCVRLPWGSGAYFGSYYFVDKDYRSRGFGTRLRDEVAYGHVVEDGGKLCIDAVKGSVAAKNISKFHYTELYLTTRITAEVKDFGEISTDYKITEANSVPFEELMAYDNKNFVSQNFPPRRKFLEMWIKLPNSCALVSLNDNGKIVGFGQRRKALQERSHMIGPLYADNVDIAKALLQKLCEGIRGENVIVNVWVPNEEAMQMYCSMGFTKVFDLIRMHANGDAKEFKPTVFGLTSIDICGF